jgi:peptidoglycan hydrolase-like protein with peptidoglycan-binding domain
MKLRIIAGWLVAGLFAVGVALAGPGAVATASPAAESGVLSHCAEISSHPNISRGASGRVVVHAQCLLVRHWGQNIVIDGVFGGATQQAVFNVQRWCGLAIDGVVGPNTWRVLHKHSVC